MSAFQLAELKIRPGPRSLLPAAVICLAAAILLDVSPLKRNLLLVGSLACGLAALALIKANKGPPPNGLPMIGFGVVMLVMGPPLSYWIYGDAFALVLRLEYPVRTAL